LRPGGAWGLKKKRFPKIKNQPGLKKGEKKKVNLSLSPWLAKGQGGDEKGAPISAPSIQIGALVGASSLWPSSMTISQEGGSLNLLYSSIPGAETFSCEVGLSYHLT